MCHERKKTMATGDHRCTLIFLLVFKPGELDVSK